MKIYVNKLLTFKHDSERLYSRKCKQLRLNLTFLRSLFTSPSSAFRFSVPDNLLLSFSVPQT